jgi:hypothetical protein
MAGDYGQPEMMGWGRCFSLRSHSTSPLIESQQVFFHPIVGNLIVWRW